MTKGLVSAARLAGVPRPSVVTGTAADAVVLASRALVGVAARSLAAIEDEITLTQYRALVVLSQHGPQSAGQLARRLEVRPSTMTGLADRLVAKGLVERATSEENRREVTITLSAQGRRIVREVIRRRRREITRILDRLDARERRAVHDALAQFAAAAEELPDDAWKLGWTQ
jgi:DNA-binding MarR family transcriptional regulator